jgi:hypothetical protein
MDVAMLANIWNRLPPDALETVTYFSKSQERIPPIGQEVPNSHRLPLSQELIGSNEQLAKYGIVIDMWAGQMTGVVWGTQLQRPKSGDVLKDSDGIKYVVQRVDLLDLKQRYRLLCLQG